MNTTKTAQFTPGPWIVECDKFIATPDAIVITELNDGLRGECPKSGHFNANAALIAAAPAMYEALRKVIEHRAEEYLDNTIEPYCSLVAALAQAEGKQ